MSVTGLHPVTCLPYTERKTVLWLLQLAYYSADKLLRVNHLSDSSRIRKDSEPGSSLAWSFKESLVTMVTECYYTMVILSADLPWLYYSSLQLNRQLQAWSSPVLLIITDVLLILRYHGNLLLRYLGSWLLSYHGSLLLRYHGNWLLPCKHWILPWCGPHDLCYNGYWHLWSTNS